VGVVMVVRMVMLVRITMVVVDGGYDEMKMVAVLF
jgi:hypothetical protein